MQNKPDTEGVNSAYDLLIEQLQETTSKIRECIVRATEEGKYDVVREFIAKAELLDKLTLQIKKQSVEFAELFPQKPCSTLLPSGITSLVLKKKIYHAKAKYQEGSVVVQKGSTLSMKEFHSLPDSIREIRNELERRGELIRFESRQVLVLSKDYKFDSPSAAAGFVLGYSANGKREWTVEDTRRSLGEELGVQRK